MVTQSSSFQLAKQYMDEMLGKSLGLMKGGGTPQELPWFKGFQDQINKGVTAQTSQLLRDATSRGVRGGTLEELLKAPSQSGTEGILKSILSIYQQNPQQTMPFINQAYERQAEKERQWLQQMQMVLNSKTGKPSTFSKYLPMGLGAIQGAASIAAAPFTGGLSLAALPGSINQMSKSMSPDPGMARGTFNMPSEFGNIDILQILQRLGLLGPATTTPPFVP